MNHLLKSKANLCRTRARVLGYDPEIIDCQEDLILIVNGKTKKVAAIGMTLNPNDKEVKFESYIIDVRKWMWAEAEGFTKEEMTDKGDLRNSIFLPIPFEKIPSALLE